MSIQMQPTSKRRVLAIDPGYDRVGVAIIDDEKKPSLIFSECITTNAKDSISARIYTIGVRIAQLIETYHPSALAIEKLYFTTNQKTAMAVAESRGVVLYEAYKNNLFVFEYTPIEIKIAVTGYGKATKENVHTMVQKLISLTEKKRLDDEIDAIAIGLTCLARERLHY